MRSVKYVGLTKRKRVRRWLLNPKTLSVQPYYQKRKGYEK